MNETNSASEENRPDLSDWSCVLSPAMPPPGIRTPLLHHNNGDRNDPAVRALLSRYRYYSRLDPGIDNSLIMPSHVVPVNFFSILPFGQGAAGGAGQGSLVTVFSIWNTMMGTAVLLMPWALNQAGLVLGLILIVLMGIVTFYTAYRVVDSTEKFNAISDKKVEFLDVCRYYLGKWGDRAALWFSLVCLIGATIVYWILMSNFLYFTGSFVYEIFNEWNSWNWTTSIGCDAACSDDNDNATDISEILDGSSTFYTVWRLRKTVPFFLVLLIFPLLNFKSPTFFTKFNGLGTISVFYLLIFVSTKVVQCGVHLDLSPGNSDGVEFFKTTFPSLTGALALSYFIHNGIVTILKNQKHPENNCRDLALGYGLVCFTYSAVAILFYISFPLNKNCIADNFLNNFGPRDILSAMARVFLLFQLLTVYPLLTYLIRSQLFYFLYRKDYPGIIRVIALNVCLVTVGILFAVFYPSIGSILRFVGSASGMVYVFALPCLVYLKRLKGEGRATRWSVALHGGIIAAGVANLVCQLFI